MNAVNMLEKPAALAGLRFTGRLTFTCSYGEEGNDRLREKIDAYLQENHAVAIAGRRAVADYVRTEARAAIVEHKVVLEHGHYPPSWRMNEDGWLENHKGKDVVGIYRPFGDGCYFLFTIDAQEDVIIVYVARIVG